MSSANGGNGHAGNGNGSAHVPGDYATTLANEGIGNLNDNAGRVCRNERERIEAANRPAIAAARTERDFRRAGTAAGGRGGRQTAPGGRIAIPAVARTRTIRHRAAVLHRRLRRGPGGARSLRARLQEVLPGPRRGHCCPLCRRHGP
jgi:hypothetical protein